ncbi:ROK family protein [Acidobacteriota bacterium]
MNPKNNKQYVKDPLIMGIDLGGTKVKSALFDIHGRILFKHRYLTHPQKGPEGIIDDIVTCANQCFNKSTRSAQALGIGIAAQIDSAGVVLSSPNLGWQNIPLKAQLEKKLKMPVVVTNDVRAASWGELLFGLGKGADDLVLLFIGTGIGGGVVSGGKMLEGCSNTAGELGHMTLVVNGRDCHCPNRGGLEAYAGGWAIAERAQEAVQKDPDKGKRLLEIAGSMEKITASIVGQAYKEGNPLANRLLIETGEFLGAGIVSIVNAFSPCLIILGGGVIEGLPELILIAENIVKNKALKPASEKARLVKASLGNDAGIIGAFALAREKYKEKY